MSVTRDVPASRKDVWNVVANGWTYSQWVVGNSRMRAVDQTWPEPGSRILHSIGVWPFVIDDETVAESCTPQEELVLLAKLGPFGGGRITLRFSDIPDGCRVEMSEVPVKGPRSVIPDALAQLGKKPRNRECLWRLGQLAKHEETKDLE